MRFPLSSKNVLAPSRSAPVAPGLWACLPAFLFGLCAAPAGAQIQAPPLAGSAPNIGVVPGNTTSLPLAASDPNSTEATDVIFGRNTAGPYALSWKGWQAGSEQVTRDGLILHSGADYMVDPAAGTLAFSTPLRTDQIVRITYSIDSPTAVHNSSAVTLPLQMDLWRQGQNHLSYGMVYRSDPNQPNSPATTANTLQFAGSTRFLPGSDLSSGLFLDLHGGDWMGRSGLRLAEQTRLKYAEFSLSYARAGALFAQQDASGLQAGNQVVAATGKLTPLQGLTLQAGLKQTTQLLDPATNPSGTNGTVTTELSDSLTLALPKNGGKLQAGSTETFVTPPDGTGQTTTQDTVQLERTLTRTTQATLGYQSLTTEPSDGTTTGATYDQKTSLGLTNHFNALTSLTGTFQNELNTTGDQDTLGWHLDTSPLARLRALKFSFNWNDTFRTDGAQRSREALVELPPLSFAGTKLSGGVRQTSASGEQMLVGILDAGLHPVRYVEVTGGVRLRDGMLNNSLPDPNASDTYNLKLALTPWKKFKLTGSMARNPENSDGTFQRTESQALGLETEFGCVQFKGQYGLEDTYQTMQRQNLLDLSLGLRLTRFDTLTTGFQDRSAFDNGLSGSQSYALNFTHHLSSVFDMTLGGTMTLYMADGTTQWDKTDLKAQANISLHF